MTDMDAVFMALAELAKQSREQAAEIEALKTAQTEDRERLNAHGMLLVPLRVSAVRRHYEAQLAQEAA